MRKVEILIIASLTMAVLIFLILSIQSSSSIWPYHVAITSNETTRANNNVMSSDRPQNCEMVLAQNGPNENLNDEYEVAAMVDPKCEVPSLQKGKVHVVIAGYKGLDAKNGFSDRNSYLFDIGLTNADYFWYRRLDAQKPLRHIEGPCGQSFHERLLLPNHGRDASALYDYIVEFYNNLPDILIFMHGHGAQAYHTNCEAIFARTVYYYRAYVNKNVLRCKGKSVLDHMMTLTSRSTTTINYTHTWFGNNEFRLSKRNTDKNSCKDFIGAKWGHVFKYRDFYSNDSCCASFIITSDRIQRYPLEFWEDMLHLVRDPTTDDDVFSRICFEFLLATLFYDEVDFTIDQVSVFYNEADSLIHGKLRNENSTGPDKRVVDRMKSCLICRNK
mmetsp:Transcript_17581/g.36942  ORF Transcript_17581/g.36942 Transcript_17581/m.36942 type:complete len:387 (-) Transcript_17581:67-1227(-)